MKPIRNSGLGIQIHLDATFVLMIWVSLFVWLDLTIVRNHYPQALPLVIVAEIIIVATTTFRANTLARRRRLTSEIVAQLRELLTSECSQGILIRNLNHPANELIVEPPFYDAESFEALRIFVTMECARADGSFVFPLSPRQTASVSLVRDDNGGIIAIQFSTPSFDSAKMPTSS